MKKSAQIGVVVIIIAVAGAGIGIGAFVFMTQQQQPTRGDIILTIWGAGTTGNFTLTLSELKSSKYLQYENLFYNYSSDRNGTYTGVSIKDILEKENLVTGTAVNFTFVSSDGFNPAVKKGYYLNITELMAADYNDCIFAYGGDSFISDPLDEDYDGIIRSVMNMTDVFTGLSGSLGAWWTGDVAQMIIL